jgi:hypothetical protein
MMYKVRSVIPLLILLSKKTEFVDRSGMASFLFIAQDKAALPIAIFDSHEYFTWRDISIAAIARVRSLPRSSQRDVIRVVSRCRMLPIWG